MREACCLWLSADRSCALGGARGRPEQPAKACLAGADRAAVGRSGRHGRDHAPDRQGQAQRLALAGALPGSRGRRSAARQDPAVAHPAAGGRSGRAGGRAARWRRRRARRPTGPVRAMAKATGISPASVQRIWAAHGLQPHRVRTFKLSKDPAFAAKLRDVVGLYVDPPAHAVVLSVDEKSQIQALDRTQPGLPMKKGRAGTMTHDYKRNGTTTLFAALNVLDGSVIGQCMQRHRHQEFIRFLNRIERDVPAGKLIHVDLRQLRHPQAPQGPRLARAARALDLPLHPDLGLLAERGRGLLRQAHPAAPPARRVPLARRPAGRDQPLPRRAQPGTQAVRLDRRARGDPRQGQTWASNVRDDPLGRRGSHALPSRN